MKPSAMNLVGPVVVSNWNSWPWFIQDGCQGGHFEIGFCNLVCDVQTRKSYSKQWESLRIKQLNYCNSNDEVHALFRSIIWIQNGRLAVMLNFLLSLLLQTDIRCRHETKWVGSVVVFNWNSWPWLIQDGCQGSHFEIGFWNQKYVMFRQLI